MQIPASIWSESGSTIWSSIQAGPLFDYSNINITQSDKCYAYLARGVAASVEQTAHRHGLYMSMHKLM